jgi:ribosomal protein S19E (S16A)
MSYQDRTVSMSTVKLISSLEFELLPKSKEKPISATRAKVRNLVTHLERVGLIALVSRGEFNSREGNSVLF